MIGQIFVESLVSESLLPRVRVFPESSHDRVGWKAPANELEIESIVPLLNKSMVYS